MPVRQVIVSRFRFNKISPITRHSQTFIAEYIADLFFGFTFQIAFGNLCHHPVTQESPGHSLDRKPGEDCQDKYWFQKLFHINSMLVEDIRYRLFSSSEEFDAE